MSVNGQTRVVRLGQLIFFSTETGDAWMLDPEDGCAACLARDGELQTIPIHETRSKLAIEWSADYLIEGEAFTVTERNGSARTILGYPTIEILPMVREFPASPVESPAGADAAQARLKTGHNDPCACGSGKKYKKCCLAKDEALVRQTANVPVEL